MDGGVEVRGSTISDVQARMFKPAATNILEVRFSPDFDRDEPSAICTKFRVTRRIAGEHHDQAMTSEELVAAVKEFTRNQEANRKAYMRERAQKEKLALKMQLKEILKESEKRLDFIKHLRSEIKKLR